MTLNKKVSAASDRFRAWREDPVLFVREVFEVEPDEWQKDVLGLFPRNQRMAMKACKGPGKTCLLAWIIWNFLLTRPYPNVAVTSITKDNLADGLWKESSKWQQRSPLLQEMFEWQKTRIVAKDPDKAPNWWASARNWSKTADAASQANTLAGLHADYILFVIDESGGAPDAIMASAEAALSSCVEGHLLQAGNPTHLEGPLYRACTSERHLWHVTEITSDPDDPKRTPRVSIQWAKEQIDKYGRNHPYVLVNVFGQFPPSSMNALIGPDEVEAAMRRMYREFEIGASPKILGVDVAKFGDDSSVIFPRQGIQAYPPLQYRNIDSIQGASVVSRKIDSWNADATFVDDTGGFGGGWIDQMKQLGYPPIPVNFSSSAHSKDKYHNKRAEMMFSCVEWIKNGGALPRCDELLQALTNTTYTFAQSSGKLIIEPKESVKQKLHGQSPDHLDALMLTFAEPVRSRSTKAGVSRHRFEYDPYADMDHHTERHGDW